MLSVALTFPPNSMHLMLGNVSYAREKVNAYSVKDS